MEPVYRNTRTELDTAIEAELRPLNRRLTELWFSLHTVTKLLNELVVDLSGSERLLHRLVLEEQEQELPLTGPGDQES